MTKRERFMKFLANEPVDRVPVAFFHHFCGPDLMEKGLELPEAFERNIEGHREALAVFDPDVIKVMNDSLMVLPLDTSFVEKPSDLRKIQPPSVNSLFGKKTKELTQRVMEIYEGKDAPIYATGFSAIRVLRGSLDGICPPTWGIGTTSTLTTGGRWPTSFSPRSKPPPSAFLLSGKSNFLPPASYSMVCLPLSSDAKPAFYKNAICASKGETL